MCFRLSIIFCFIQWDWLHNLPIYWIIIKFSLCHWFHIHLHLFFSCILYCGVVNIVHKRWKNGPFLHLLQRDLLLLWSDNENSTYTRIPRRDRKINNRRNDNTEWPLCDARTGELHVCRTDDTYHKTLTQARFWRLQMHIKK